jgi:ABC-type glycerol-3-phosphate transport system substrate-binding protein
MRWIIVGLVGLLIALTFYGQLVIVPEQNVDRGMIRAFWQMTDHPKVAPLIADYREHYRATYGEGWPDVTPLLAAREALDTATGDERDRLRGLVADLEIEEERFRSWYNATQPQRLDEIPRLVWATDANPARAQQCQLFREWHLENYGEPIDIVTDPASRGKTLTTKVIIQCIAGAGPDIIESYGPAQLLQFVQSGIALDITDVARERGFGLDRIFPAVHSSLAYDGRQYGFTCNVGYVVLLYHRDLFREASVPEPTEPWTIDEFIEVCRQLSDFSSGRRRYGVLGLHPWPMSLAYGGEFYAHDGAVSYYNSPETVQAFRDFQDMIYTHKIMPSPAESASMAAQGGFGEGNIRLFVRKAAAITTGGRWDYATLAQYNRDRVITPAIDRTIDDPATDETTRESLRRIKSTLQLDVLQALTDEDDALMRSVLTDDDRAKLLDIGVAHFPSPTGRPVYEAGGRVSLVNRASPYAEYAMRFIEFLASEAYNEQINQTFDSICGMPEYCTDEDGISGPPKALPGLEGLDSPVFYEAMQYYAAPRALSPFIGDQRMGELVSKVMDQLQNGAIGPAEAARLSEDRINRQIRENLRRDADLRARWEGLTGLTFDPEQSSLRAMFADDGEAGG